MVDRQKHGDADVYLGGTANEGAVLYLSGWGDFPIYHDKVPELLENFEEKGFAVMAAPYSGTLGQPGEFSVEAMMDNANEYASILADYAGTEDITAVGNCMGGNASIGTLAETDIVKRAVTMNTLFGLRNDEWWNSDEEWEQRVARWPKIREGKDGMLGTEFVGLDEEYFKETISKGKVDRTALGERVDEFAHKPILMMVSYEDELIDPLHTMTMYKYVRNEQERQDIEEKAELRVVTEQDPFHIRLLVDEELQNDVAKWIKNTD